MMTENAIANPRFLAALRGRVDRTTLAGSAVDRVLVGAVPQSAGGDLVRRGDARVLAGGRRRRPAHRRADAPGGHGRKAGVTARWPASGGRSSPPPARRRSVRACPRCCCWPSGSTRRCWPRWPGDRAGRFWSATDAARSGSWGPGVAQLEALVGQETSGDVALPEPGVHAAAVAIAPGLWLWSLGRAGELEQVAAAADRTRRQVSWAVAIPLASRSPRYRCAGVAGGARHPTRWSRPRRRTSRGVGVSASAPRHAARSRRCRRWHPGRGRRSDVICWSIASAKAAWPRCSRRCRSATAASADRSSSSGCAPS